MDQGTSGDITITEFSRSMAIFSLSGSISRQSWWVKIAASVWLQETMDVAADTAIIPPKGVSRSPSPEIYFFMLVKSPVPSKIPE